MLEAVSTVIFVLIGITLGVSATLIFNRIPAAWLCDYDEEPGIELEGLRISNKLWGTVFSLGFTAAAICLWMSGTGCMNTVFSLFAVWILLQIAIADYKYRIIPDQYLMGLMLISVILIGGDYLHIIGGDLASCRFHTTLLSPVLGALLCGGGMFAVAYLTSVLFKRETMGFGDIKLLAVCGLLSGVYGGAFILLCSIFLAGICSAALLLAGKLRSKDEAPFGPYIALACGLYIIFYPEINLLFVW